MDYKEIVEDVIRILHLAFPDCDDEIDNSTVVRARSILYPYYYSSDKADDSVKASRLKMCESYVLKNLR